MVEFSIINPYIARQTGLLRSATCSSPIHRAKTADSTKIMENLRFYVLGLRLTNKESTKTCCVKNGLHSALHWTSYFDINSCLLQIT